MKRSAYPISPEIRSKVSNGASHKPVRQILALTVLAAASCAAMATEYTVVVLQSLTGGAAFIGAPLKDGAVLAAEEINKKSELGAGNSLKLVVADDANDRAQVLQLLTRYAADPNVLMVMGPTSGAVAVAAASAANDLKLPLMNTGNSTDVLKAGPWSTIITQPATLTIPYIANYAAEKLKVKNCTVIGISDVEAYVTLQKTFESSVKAKGVTIGAVEAIKGSDSDFAALATKVAGGNEDCVFISASAPQAANIVIQLRQAGLDPKVKVMGHNSLASPQFAERGGKAVEGVYLMGDWVPGGADDQGKAFAAAYKAKYNTDADNWAAVGYSAMRVALAALKAAGATPTRDTVRVAKDKVKDVKVVVGQGTFYNDAERVPHFGMNVLTVHNGKFVLAP
jgi:branched-chain amino acid transport system substrate-binding protein